MGKKRTSSPALPVAAVVLVLLVVLSAWLYQTAMRQAWFAAHDPPATQIAPQAHAPDAPPAIARDLRIATWNIRQLGARSSTDIRQVAKLIGDHDFDIVAIQEIYHDGVDRLLNELGFPWRGTSVGPPSRTGQRLSYIYRGDRVIELKPAANLPGATHDVFSRIPYSAAFKSGEFDFELITVHFSWSDVAQRKNEMRALKQLVERKIATQSEKDIILLGDFNEQKSRPNLDYLREIGWHSVTTEPTNLSSREIYDHIVIHPRHTIEYLGRTGVIRFDEIHFANDDKTAADALSDHRPVYADFATHFPDDD